MSKEREITELATELMKFKSTSRNQREIENIVSFAENYFENKKLFVKRYEKNKKHALVVTFEDSKTPKIFLNGHLDVVDASDEEFMPRIESGILFGRGAADMKGAVASMMKVIDYFAEHEIAPSLGLMLTTDEEEGGFDGVGYLLGEEGFACDIAIIPDGGKNTLAIVNKAKGVLQIKVVARGRSAHGSTPWSGDNAIDKILIGYLNSRKIFPNINSQDLWESSLNLGVIKGGDKANKVPEYAEMFLDIRLTEKEDMEDIFKKICDAFKDCEVEKIATGAIFFTSEHNKYMNSYVETLQQTTGEEVYFTNAHGASDARFFAAKNIPAIVNQPLSGNIHAEKEWINIKAMETFYEVLVQYIKKEGY